MVHVYKLELYDMRNYLVLEYDVLHAALFKNTQYIT
jgi:hypothetical protein